MILHQTVKKDLVLVTQRGQESMFQDDGWLLFHSAEKFYIEFQRTEAHLEELVPCSRTLLLQTVHVIWQETFQTKDGSLLACESGSLANQQHGDRKRPHAGAERDVPC
jgi:ectoine hydroxylase-related dioxygenase (phytanoyl-CoA dioxygenase family)